jgi:hypothetical protein
MGDGISRIYFDQRDYQLLSIVNDVLNRDESFSYLKTLLYPYLHPRGIKEMAASRGLRIAYAVVHLLESLEAGKADDRLSALRSLRDEITYSADSHLQKNTARVLLEIMKELVRTLGNKRRQLELAHDFRTATSGKPRIIRAFLRRYHLLEMPEEWNQVAFDGHVHDSHTKGRKSPSHLIMDAWIKGIRHLTVIYYNYLPANAAAELLEASEVMGIRVRIGVELPCRFRNQYVQLIWVPRGFSDVQDFLSFLAYPHVESFMKEGREVSQYQQRYVLAVLREFNERHRVGINDAYGLEIPPLDQTEFLAFVGTGQASLLHLAKFIHARVLPAMEARVAVLREHYSEAGAEEREQIATMVEEMNNLDSETIVECCLRPAQNPGVPDPHIPCDHPDVPRLLNLSPYGILDRVSRLHSGYSITLNLSKLKVEDVLELLYDCKGAISHLEIFNLKDCTDGRMSYNYEINELQRSINEGNVIALKRHIRGIIQRMEASEQEHEAERIEKFREILRNIPTLQAYYKKAPLKARIGSDSTGSSRRLHGMGFVVKHTLPYRVQKELDHSAGFPRLTIPVNIEAFLHTTHIPQNSGSSKAGHWVYRLLRLIPGLRLIGQTYQKDWVVKDFSTRIGTRGNTVALGGVYEESGNGLHLGHPQREKPQERLAFKYLNSSIKNGLKVFIGFVPAFATFFLTHDWWLLAYFGAFIWYGITGVRNILQSVLGAGGISRSPLIRWESYVSWDRICDSLLYTGFSVPLLEFVVKTELLDRTFGVTVRTNPYLLYTVMAMANGLYLFSHNTWRGLPKAAAVGNLFRTVLSIPLAIVMNAAIGGILAGFDVPDIAGVLQKWAAIISKAASDCVAGVIEGTADRYKYIRMRAGDYSGKMAQLFDTYAQLELLFPEADVLKMLESPKEFIRTLSVEALGLEKIILINALDLLYFWMYQPRARSVLCSRFRTMSNEERQIFVRSQSVLRRKREISQLFVNGIVGKEFFQALSFYLDRSEEYLDAIEKIASKPCRTGAMLWRHIRLKKHGETMPESLKI